VPILTVHQGLDEAFPAVARWVRTLGRIEIGVEEGQGFVVRAVERGDRRVFYQDTGSTSLDEALKSLERGMTGSNP
jgi:hypothetical protein